VTLAAIGLASGFALGWLAALAYADQRGPRPVPDDTEARDSDDEESGW
jgi:hypothetical protein